MASLISAIAKALRRYNSNAMLVLADLVEEHELHECARLLRKTESIPIEGLSESYSALLSLRNMVRRPAKRTLLEGVAMRRYLRWAGTDLIKMHINARYGKETVPNSRIIYGTTPTPHARRRSHAPNCASIRTHQLPCDCGLEDNNEDFIVRASRVL